MSITRFYFSKKINKKNNTWFSTRNEKKILRIIVKLKTRFLKLDILKLTRLEFHILTKINL